jgi:hypothetical protein
MPGFWDDPDIKKAAESGAYGKFVEVGDTVAGTIADMKKVEFPGVNGPRTAVEVEFDDETKCTFGQVLMMRDLFVYQPNKGDHLSVTLANVQKNGAKTLKLFKGTITRANGEVQNFDQTVR